MEKIGCEKMVEIMADKGLSGLSRCFRGAVSKFGKDGKLLFIGSPFTCLPFAEFLAYGIRDFPIRCYFMAGTDISSITKLVPKEGLGFQLGAPEKWDGSKFDVAVLLGGLAMPKSQILPKHLKEQLIRVCAMDFNIALFFQGIMKKPEWMDEFNFMYIVDADLSLVTLEEFL